MSRNVEFNNQEMVLHLTGILSLAALKRQVVIPYRAIENSSWIIRCTFLDAQNAGNDDSWLTYL
jgi:hypothetical protein